MSACRLAHSMSRLVPKCTQIPSVCLLLKVTRPQTQRAKLRNYEVQVEVNIAPFTVRHELTGAKLLICVK